MVLYPYVFVIKHGSLCFTAPHFVLKVDQQLVQTFDCVV